MRRALFWILWCGSSIALAHTPDEALKRGAALYLRADFTGALRELDAGVSAHPEDSALSALQLERGLCFAALKDERAMNEAFTAALTANPAAELDRARVLPSVVDALDALRGTLRGTLDLSVDPPSAVIELDGALVEGRPFPMAIHIGSHDLRVRDAHGHHAEQTVRVLPNQTVHVSLSIVASEVAAAPLAVVVAEKPRRKVDFGLDFRAHLADFNTVGAEVDVVVAGGLFVAEAGVLFGDFPAFDLRVGLRSPLWFNFFRLYGTVDGAAFLGANPKRLGPGGSLGATFRVLSFLDLLAEANVFGLFAPGLPARTDGVFDAGVRLWLP